MKVKAYPNNPYYQLLIRLLIVLGVSDFKVANFDSIKSLGEEAVHEIRTVLKLNKELKNKFNLIKFYPLTQLLGLEKDFPSF